MCRCYICDKSMDDVKLDVRDMKTRPCAECEAVVNEIVASHEDAEYAYIEPTIEEFLED